MKHRSGYFIYSLEYCPFRCALALCWKLEKCVIRMPFLSFPKSHEANSHAVRFRTCQLVNKILGNMPENAEIDDDLFDKINEAMLIRLKDKFPSVRIQAVLALSRLQDPKDENCPVVNSK